MVSFKGLRSSSARASASAKGASKKRDTKPERVLRRALWSAGHRYRTHVCNLPGRPDLAFVRERIAVFVDGDFWHGRDWENRKRKLARGHNATYWVSKIERNRARDRAQSEALTAAGWQVVRLWEGDVLKDPRAAVETVEAALEARRRVRGEATVSLVSGVPPISRFESPTLRALAELGGEGSNAEIEQTIARTMSLSEEQLKAPHPGEGRTEFSYRAAWARTRLGKAGLIERAGRGRWRLTEAGHRRAEGVGEITSVDQRE